jgi:hypothetical protein
VSDHRYTRSLIVAAPPELAVSFFSDGEAWFRLNPEWEVLEFKDSHVKVRYERSEVEAEWRITKTDFGAEGGTVLFDGESARRIELKWEPAADNRTLLAYREEFPAALETARLAELNLWLDAAAGYLAIAARGDRRGRLMRWLLDRVWLRMTPTSRRVGLIVVAMEALALLLFIAVILVFRFSG